MAQRVAGRGLVDSGHAQSCTDRPLDILLVKVMTPFDTGSGAPRKTRSREDPLPPPFAPGGRVLSGQRPGKLNPGDGGQTIAFKCPFRVFKLIGKSREETARKRGRSR